MLSRTAPRRDLEGNIFQAPAAQFPQTRGIRPAASPLGSLVRRHRITLANVRYVSSGTGAENSIGEYRTAATCAPPSGTAVTPSNRAGRYRAARHGPPPGRSGWPSSHAHTREYRTIRISALRQYCRRAEVAYEDVPAVDLACTWQVTDTDARLLRRRSSGWGSGPGTWQVGLRYTGGRSGGQAASAVAAWPDGLSLALRSGQVG
jgi:hypothetical protein